MRDCTRCPDPDVERKGAMIACLAQMTESIGINGPSVGPRLERSICLLAMAA